LTTDLDRMILAARQIGEVVGEDLVGPVTTEGRLWLGIDGDDNTWALDEQNTLDLLTARVWRAVQGWQEGAKCAVAWYGTNWVDVLGGEEHHTQGYPDLPSAVAAIHRHFKENR
jgi:hypothetical protein